MSQSILPIEVVSPRVPVRLSPSRRRSIAWRIDFDGDPEPIIPPYDFWDPDFLRYFPPHYLRAQKEESERSKATVQSTPAPPTEQVLTPTIEPIVSNSIAPPTPLCQHLYEPDEDSNDLLPVPVPVPQKPEVVPELDSPSVNAPDSSDSLVSSQEYVLPYCDRHERPLNAH